MVSGKTPPSRWLNRKPISRNSQKLFFCTRSGGCFYKRETVMKNLRLKRAIIAGVMYFEREYITIEQRSVVII